MPANKKHLLREIAEELVGLLPVNVDVLAGLELGGVPLGVVAVIEDVVTTGGQVIESCRELRAREGRYLGDAVRDRPRGRRSGEPCR